MIHDEIGGFFEMPELIDIKEENSCYNYLIQKIDKNYPNFEFIRDGRQALKWILIQNEVEARKNQILIPKYLCESIIQPFSELDLDYAHYEQSDDLSPKINFNIKNSIVLIIDYFGIEQISQDEIQQLLNNGCIVIIDISHSILNTTRFNLVHENIYLFASLRKIFPIPDGGVVYSFQENPKKKKIEESNKL